MVLADERLCLSRHAALRPGGEGLVLETPFGPRGYPVSSPAVLTLLLALARPVRVADLLATVDEERRGAVLRFLAQLRDEGVLTAVDAEGRLAEDRGPVGHWEPHDLFFHARSRRGRTSRVVGATFPLQGVLPPEPPLRDARGTAPLISLRRPDLAQLERRDPPLSWVLEARRSRYSLAPVPLESLAELLFRAFRVTGVEELAGDETVVRKVYPSGGSRHPLELYVVAWACPGLERGVYHYRSSEHALAPVCGFDGEVERFLEEARDSTGWLAAYPPVLLVLSARFRRVTWKYQALAYAAILKEVGGVYQTLYLVATAMGLSPCALGAGDSDRFARVAGTDYYGETSVGEFIVGGPGGLTGLEMDRRLQAGGGRLGAEGG